MSTPREEEVEPGPGWTESGPVGRVRGTGWVPPDAKIFTASEAEARRRAWEADCREAIVRLRKGMFE